MELQGYSQLMCNKLRASSHDTLDYRRSNPQALPSITFIDHTTDLPWQHFLSLGKVPEGSTLIFGGTRISLQHGIGQVKGSSHAENQLVSIQYWLVTDKQTDGHITTANTKLA